GIYELESFIDVIKDFKSKCYELKSFIRAMKDFKMEILELLSFIGVMKDNKAWKFKLESVIHDIYVRPLTPAKVKTHGDSYGNSTSPKTPQEVGFFRGG